MIPDADVVLSTDGALAMICSDCGLAPMLSALIPIPVLLLPFLEPFFEEFALRPCFADVVDVCAFGALYAPLHRLDRGDDLISAIS
jgi:hypothetical protein